jgi:ribosome-binding factor A
MSKKYEQRITDLVRTHVCELLEREINDPRVKGITVTDVEVTQDTKYATVFYSVIGDDARKDEVSAGLRSARGWVSRALGKRLRTRNTPHVKFEFDGSLERGDRMSQLLDEIKAVDATRPNAASASSEPDLEQDGAPADDAETSN